ncbi:MAG: hypothetical protein LBT32_07350 [Peptococcaceae bacterium]|jgi:hypothetical protein|nr:hypothetical protein [Peptococcaceae bacterium]
MDEVTWERLDKLLTLAAELEGFGEDNDAELSEEDLDRVSAGSAVPDYQAFLRYVRRREKSGSSADGM